MATFEVNNDGLLDASSELTGINNRILSTIENLQQMLSTYNSKNVGEAAIGFTSAQDQWNAGTTEMSNAINKAASSLDEINENYKRADRQGAMYFDELSL